MLALLAVLCSFSFAMVGKVYAHALVETGVAQADEAAFEEAVASFDAAWKLEQGLTRDDVVALLANRAVANFALHSAADVDRDLSFLAVIDREYAFARHVPPAMRERFEHLRKQTAEPRISALTRFAGGNATFTVEVEDMPDGLAREVRLFARPVGNTTWSSAVEPVLAIENPENRAVEWYVHVLGPGGAVILRQGGPETPLRALPAPIVQPPPPASALRPPPVSPSRAWRWWAIGGSTAAAAAVAATVTALLVREPAQTTQVSSPVLR